MDSLHEDEVRNEVLKYVFIVICFLSTSMSYPLDYAKAVSSDWLTIPGMTQVPLNKIFTVSFNKDVTLGDIDGMVIFHNGKFLPVTIETKGRQAYITPIHDLTRNTEYELIKVPGPHATLTLFKILLPPP